MSSFRIFFFDDRIIKIKTAFLNTSLLKSYVTQEQMKKYCLKKVVGVM